MAFIPGDLSSTGKSALQHKGEKVEFASSALLILRSSISQIHSSSGKR